MNNKEIANALEEVSLLLELKGENQFRVRAYQNASRIVSESPLSTESLIEQAKQKEIKGLGAALTEHIEELYRDGDLRFLRDLQKEFPETLLGLLEIRGLGAKKLKVLYEQLHITSIDELEAACRNNAVAELKGFGEKTQEKFLIGIEQLRAFRGKFLFFEAHAAGKAILEKLQDSGLCEHIEFAGSLRRKKEIIGDIDILAASKTPEKLIEQFVSLGAVSQITAQGETKASVVLVTGVAVDLRVVTSKEFPAALLYFSGSKEHNTALRTIAKKHNLKLNEYGLFKEEVPLPTDSEEAIYNHLGLCFVPPETREDNGELEFAAKMFLDKKQFPKLVAPEEIQGILHAHTTYSDGEHSLREMALAAKQLGYGYIGITDHSQTASYAGGLKPKDVVKQHKEIEALNAELHPFRIYKGIESDILPDGSLDYTDTELETFDFVIASVHSKFNMNEAEMTARILKAIEHPATTILGHLTGRLLLKREGYPVDVPKILEAAAENNVAVEINAHPRRLDLDWRHYRKAKELGVTLSICPDAHSTSGIEHVRYGAFVARKGWLTKEDILTCWERPKVEEFFKKRK